MKHTTQDTFMQFQKDVLMAIRDALDGDKISTAEAFGILELLKAAEDEGQFRMIARGLANNHSFLARIFEKSEEGRRKEEEENQKNLLKAGLK